jgi:hypothetical protein
LISRSPYQQLVVDKELIVGKVVLINKEPYGVVSCVKDCQGLHALLIITVRASVPKTPFPHL